MTNHGTDTSPKQLVALLPEPVRGPLEVILSHIQHGTFQRSMSLLVFGTSVVSGRRGRLRTPIAGATRTPSCTRP